MLPYVLNPFSEEAKKTIKSSPPVKDIPDSVFKLAEKKIFWEENRRDVIETYDVKEDVLSFYLLFHSAAKFGKHSQQSRAVKEIVRGIIEKRIQHLLNKYAVDTKSDLGYDKRFIADVMSGVFEVELAENFDVPEGDLKIASQSQVKEDRIKYAVKWRHLIPVLRARKTSLAELYLVKGYVLLSLNGLIEFFCENISGLVDGYLSTLDEAKKLPTDERLNALGALLTSAAPQYVYAPKIEGNIQARLSPDLFPPCIRQTIEGVTSGSRNYAITVLLTSFLSYARLAPFSSTKDAKISDYTKDIKVVTDEVLPLIYQAAERCSPPLFEDQPLEKMNVSYHLGFGLVEDVRLEDSGKSNWYFVSNCDKIMREAPSLCMPDALCKEIKNPLNYYVKKRFPKREEQKEEVEEVAAGKRTKEKK